MSYIGNEPTSVAFLTDTFSGNGSTTAFTLSAAPAGTSSILVSITGVVQDPTTYSTTGTTLTFSAAPPSGTGNISVRFLGIPASGVTTTAYRTVTEFTATAGQTTFSVPSYTVGFIDVYRNGVMLGSADYTASNGVSVVLASGATAGDLVEVISFSVSSVLNAIQNGSGTVSTTNLADGSVTTAKIADANVTAAKLASGAALSNLGTAQLADVNMPAGSVLQVVSANSLSITNTTSTSFVATSLLATITPVSSSSKILILCSYSVWGNANAEYCVGTIFRDSTNLGTGNYSGLSSTGGYAWGGTNGYDIYSNIMYLDSPTTTSATTYRLYVKSFNGNQISVVDSAWNNSITLLEIAA